jgi:3-oxoacyl-[acyl-carrier protein] reductase
MHPELEHAFSLEGRVAVVTGAASGIGRQAAVTFSQAGADVVAADVSADGLEITQKLVQETGRHCLVRRTDVTSRLDVNALADQTVSEFGHIEVWANVAGILRYGAIVDMPEDVLRAVVDVNLLGVYWGVAAAGRAMSSSGSGSIINVSSAGGEMASAGRSVYGMTKAGVIYLTKAAAVEMGPQGIRVNAIGPGWTETGMTSHYFTDGEGNVDSEVREQTLSSFAAGSPLSITGEPIDQSLAMLYLASDASRFMTGQVLRPNGGILMV